MSEQEQRQCCINAIIAALIETSEQCLELAGMLGYHDLALADDDAVLDMMATKEMKRRCAAIVADMFCKETVQSICLDYGQFERSFEGHANYDQFIEELKDFAK